MLKSTLLANAVSCSLFGLIFLFFGPSVSVFIGDPPVWLIQFLGVGLLVNTIHLIWVARSAAPSNNNILYFAVGDAAWVLATVTLLTAELWITTIEGIISSIAVAFIVSILGWLQWQNAPDQSKRASHEC